MMQAFQQLLGKPDKGPVFRFLVAALRILARQPVFIPVLAWFIWRQVERIGPEKTSDAIQVLVLNRERWESDLAILGSDTSLRLLALPSGLQATLNAIWLSPAREALEADPDEFFRARQPVVAEARAGLCAWLVLLLAHLQRRYQLDLIATCTFWYKQDMDWMKAGKIAGVPTVALHKECLQDPALYDNSIRRYRHKGINFEGSRIVLHNWQAKSVFQQAGIAPGDLFAISGILRLDGLFRQAQQKIMPKRQITLFSFHHCTGLLRIPGSRHFFYDDPDKGFFRYFEIVHAAMAQIAAENPDVDVWVKPKWIEDWGDRIKTAMRNAGYEPDALPNLHISTNKKAEQLIEESAVIVGINSTTLIEAKLMNRAVVIPIFAEAREKYFENHVRFQRFLDKDFNTVWEEDELVHELMAELDGKREIRSISADLVSDYVGYFDGQTLNRVSQLLHKEAAKDALETLT